MATTTDIGWNRRDDDEVSGDVVPVLVVDDGEAFRRAAAAVIAATDGFVLAGAVASGEEAIAFLERNRAALVLMDVYMPGMGGLRAADQIRARFAGVEVVLLSIHDARDLPAAVMSSGARFCGKAQFGPEQLERLWHDGGSTED